MGTLPAAGIGEENEEVPPRGGGWLARARKLAGEKLSYALGDQIVYSFGNMVVMAMIGRHCATRELGIYILTQRALDVVIQLCNVFFWGPFVFNYPGTAEERKAEYRGSILLHQVIACVIACLCMFAMQKWAHTPERGIYYGVFQPLVFATAGIVFREFTRRMYFAEMRFKEAFWTEVATIGLQVAGVEWLYLRHNLDVPSTLMVLSAGAVIVSLWWLAREAGRVLFSLSAMRSDLLLNLKLGRWFFGSNMVFTVSSQANPWILSAFLGGASVGEYAVCESVVNIPRVALVSIQNVMAPMMARAFTDGGKPALRKLVKRLDLLLLAGSSLFAVGIVVLGPWVAGLIFHATPQNHKLPDNARWILALLSMNLVAIAARLAQSYGLTALGKAGKTFYANVCGLLAQVAMSLWLVHAFHIAGAAAAMLIGSAVVMAVRGVFYAREMKAA